MSSSLSPNSFRVGIIDELPSRSPFHASMKWSPATVCVDFFHFDKMVLKLILQLFAARPSKTGLEEV